MDELRTQYDIHPRTGDDDDYWSALCDEFAVRLENKELDVGAAQWSDVINKDVVMTDDVLEEIERCEAAQSDLDDAYHRLQLKLASNVTSSIEFQRAVDHLDGRETRRKRKRVILEELGNTYREKIEQEQLDKDIDSEDQVLKY